jgi:hypothetical protein
VARIRIIGEQQKFFVVAIVAGVALAVKLGTAFGVGRVRVRVERGTSRSVDAVRIPVLSGELRVRRPFQTIARTLLLGTLKRFVGRVDTRNLSGTVFRVVKQIGIQTDTLPALVRKPAIRVWWTVGRGGPHPLASVLVAFWRRIRARQAVASFTKPHPIDLVLSVAFDASTSEFAGFVARLAIEIVRAHLNVVDALGQADIGVGEVFGLYSRERLEVVIGGGHGFHRYEVIRRKQDDKERNAPDK